MPRIGDLERLGWGISGAPTPWFASILGIHACHTCGVVTLFELLGVDAQFFHAPEALERELFILVVEVQEFS